MPVRTRLILALVVASGLAAARLQAEPVSLLRFNPPGARAELAARQRAYPLHMGIKERDGHPTEHMVLRILLGDETVGIACERIRRELDISSDAADRRESVRRLDAWIREATTSPDFAERYLSYRGESGEVDPDFLIYMTPHEKVARFYGEVILEIHEATPRGIDLNAVNRERYGYYDSLDLAEKLNPKAALIRNFLDRDEYVIPSHVPADEIRAFTIRARLPRILGKRMVTLTGRKLRRYQRGGAGDHQWIDVQDRRGRHMARFTLAPEVEAAPPSTPRSRRDLPAELLERIAATRISGRRILTRR